MDENMLEHFGWQKMAESLGISGPREHWFAIVRYVDDVFIATRWFCPCCVEKLVSTIYAGTVTFDPACDELTSINKFTSVKFLDLWCYMSWNIHFFALVNKNDLVSSSGVMSFKC